MKPARRISASTAILPTSVRQLRLLLLGLLAFGLFLSLPSAEATTAQAADGNRAERLLTSTPYIVASNDLLRQFRSTCNNLNDADSGPEPVLLGLPCDALPAAVPQTSLFLSAVSSLSPLPVSSLPGAPRGPPASPL